MTWTATDHRCRHIYSLNNNYSVVTPYTDMYIYCDYADLEEKNSTNPCFTSTEIAIIGFASFIGLLFITLVTICGIAFCVYFAKRNKKKKVVAIPIRITSTLCVNNLDL